MKTAEEWAVRSIDRASQIADIKAIQLDAYRAGMLRAAEMVVPDGNPEGAIKRILTAAESLALEDLK